MSRIDLAIHVGFGEAVGARIQFLLVLFRLESQRIELGVEVAADAVGADQHQRVNRIARCLQDVGRCELDTLRLRRCRDLLADLLFGFGPLAVERRDQIAVGTHGPVRLLPGGPARAFDDVGLLVLQALEKGPPLGIDRGRIGFVFGVEIFDVGGIAAVEERRVGKDGVGVLAGHGLILARPEKCAPHRGRKPAAASMWLL